MKYGQDSAKQLDLPMTFGAQDYCSVVRMHACVCFCSTHDIVSWQHVLAVLDIQLPRQHIIESSICPCCSPKQTHQESI